MQVCRSQPGQSSTQLAPHHRNFQAICGHGCPASQRQCQSSDIDSSHRTLVYSADQAPGGCHTLRCRASCPIMSGRSSLSKCWMRARAPKDRLLVLMGCPCALSASPSSLVPGQPSLLWCTARTGECGGRRGGCRWVAVLAEEPPLLCRRARSSASFPTLVPMSAATSANVGLHAKTHTSVRCAIDLHLTHLNRGLLRAGNKRLSQPGTNVGKLCRRLDCGS